ncbi:MAG TPA: ribonuclease P protein component [Alphaproteobacteria bacterium]|nr:ribonuclease P protein component [Alphaproteobacteria bacterium]
MPAEIGRLTRRREFLRVARGRRKWAAPGLVLQASRSPAPPAQRGEREPAAGDRAGGGALFRVGFTASRKVGGAVQRNRAKRRLRAVVGAVMPDLAAPGHDYVIIARGATLTRDFSALKDDLRAALARLRVRRGDVDRAPDTNAQKTGD